MKLRSTTLKDLELLIFIADTDTNILIPKKRIYLSVIISYYVIDINVVIATQNLETRSVSLFPSFFFTVLIKYFK